MNQISDKLPSTMCVVLLTQQTEGFIVMHLYAIYTLFYFYFTYHYFIFILFYLFIFLGGVLMYK